MYLQGVMCLGSWIYYSTVVHIKKYQPKTHFSQRTREKVHSRVMCDTSLFRDGKVLRNDFRIWSTVTEICWMRVLGFAG
jgi:hypothetical protein